MAEPVPPSAVSARLSAAERDAAVARLSAAFADDVIQMEEFERRTTLALRAGSAAELAALLADLPAPPAGARPAVAPASAGKAVARASTAHRIRAVFGNVERRGTQEIPARLEVRSVFGNVELDLAGANFTAEVTEIAMHAVFGNIELRLPAGAIVENHGESTLGSFKCRAPSVATTRDALRIVVTGRAVFGNVEITTASATG